MKIILEDYRFTYSVDYDRLKIVDTEKGTVEEYQPSVKEIIQNFLSLLEILVPFVIKHYFSMFYFLIK